MAGLSKSRDFPAFVLNSDSAEASKDTEKNCVKNAMLPYFVEAVFYSNS